MLFDWFQAGQRDLDLRRAAEQLAHDTRKTETVNLPDLYASDALNTSDGIAIITRNGNVAVSFGKKLPESAAKNVLMSASAHLMTLDDGKQRYRIATQPLRSTSGIAATALAWRNEDSDEALDRNLILAFTLGMPVVLLTAILGGWLAAGRGLAPLRAMAATASAIAAERLEARVEEPVSNDELTTLARALNRMLERLQAAFERERRLTGDVSHELRAPLAVIRAAADHALGRPNDAATLYSSMKTVALEADELETTISEVLAAARSEAAVSSSGSTDAAAAIFDVVEELYPLSRSRAIKISVDTGEETLMRVDERAFVRALRAVVHNAVMHATSHVAVRAKAAGGLVRIDVIDDGPGFSADGLIHAKERFWREDSARSRGAGSGLGLAIADELLRRYGGSLSLSNEPEGAKVTLELRPLSSQ